MHRAMYVRHLKEAERHVSQGERHIAQQENRIANLRSGGHDVTDSEKLLQLFRDMQALHVAHRDRIMEELEK